MSPVFGHGRLRLYLLKLLDESPRHGYEIIRSLEDTFLGLYAPSAGTVYPRLTRLEEEGRVVSEEDGGRRIYRLTDAGRAELRARHCELADLEADIAGSVRDLARDVRDEVRASVRGLKDELRNAARDARRVDRHAARVTSSSDRQLSREVERAIERFRVEARLLARDAAADIDRLALKRCREVLDDALVELRAALGQTDVA